MNKKELKALKKPATSLEKTARLTKRGTDEVRMKALAEILKQPAL
jgi:hypothetical protein